MANDPARSKSDDPLGWLPCYRAVLFTENQNPAVVVIDAASDDEALALATDLAEGRAFELWDALVRIGQYPPR